MWAMELGAPWETFQDDASGRAGPGPGCVPAPAELRESCASLVVGVVLIKLRSFAVWTKSPWGSGLVTHPDGQLTTDKCETWGFGFQL